MIFINRSVDTVKLDVYVTGENLAVVPEYKYLGFRIDSNLTVKKQFESDYSESLLIKFP